MQTEDESPRWHSWGNLTQLKNQFKETKLITETGRFYHSKDTDDVILNSNLNC